jgi:hypothetical protein
MSDESRPINPDGSPPLPLPPQLPPPQNGCLTAFLILLGCVMLLPGLCSLLFVFGGLVKSADDIQFVALCLTVGAAGVGLIWWATRGRRS